MVLIDLRLFCLKITQIAKKSLSPKKLLRLPDASALQRLANNDSQPNESFDFSDVPALFIFVRSLMFVFFLS